MSSSWQQCSCGLVFQQPLPNGCCPKCGQADSPASPPCWYYARNKEKHGPVSLDQLNALLNSGQLLPTDMVLQEGEKKWVFARSVNGLFIVAAPEANPHPPSSMWQKPNTPLFSDSQVLGLIGCVVFEALLAWVILYDSVLLWMIFWTIVGGVIGAVINSKKGYDGLVGFMAGALLGPVLVWLFLLPGKGLGLKKCPYCAEWVKKQSTVCRFCQREIPPVVPAKELNRVI
jgi:hypothetical protein